MESRSKNILLINNDYSIGIFFVNKFILGYFKYRHKMKKIVFVILVILTAFQTVGFSQTKKDRREMKSDTIAADSLEHRLIILDPAFESWFATQPDKNFYSNSYYAQRNQLFVQEWNRRYMTSNNKDLYDNYIEYDPKIDYGIDINYKLYYYFKYFEHKYHLKLLGFDQE